MLRRARHAHLHKLFGHSAHRASCIDEASNILDFQNHACWRSQQALHHVAVCAIQAQPAHVCCQMIALLGTAMAGIQQSDG